MDTKIYKDTNGKLCLMIYDIQQIGKITNILNQTFHLL